MSDDARPTPPAGFPLDAEQTVRLVAAVVAEVLDAIRSPGAPRCERNGLLLVLGEAAGVDLPVRIMAGGFHLVRPYGATSIDERPPGTARTATAEERQLWAMGR